MRVRKAICCNMHTTSCNPARYIVQLAAVWCSRPRSRHRGTLYAPWLFPPERTEDRCPTRILACSRFARLTADYCDSAAIPRTGGRCRLRCSSSEPQRSGSGYLRLPLALAFFFRMNPANSAVVAKGLIVSFFGNILRIGLAGSFIGFAAPVFLSVMAGLACNCFFLAAAKALYFNSGILSTDFSGQVFAKHSLKCFTLIPNSASLLIATGDRISSDRKQ